MTKRAVAALALLSLLTTVVGCDILSPHRPAPIVVPWLAPILRGDMVSYFSCSDWDHCAYPYTSQVLSRWSVQDSSVAVLLGTSPTTLVPSAGSVLVRGVAAGRASLSVTHPDGGDVTTMPIIVADSSDITRMDVFIFGPDSMRVVSQYLVRVTLYDAKGMWYLGSPTAWSVSDTTVLKVSPAPNIFGRFDLSLQPLKPGTVSLVFRFLDLTVTRSIRVVQ